MRKVLLFTVVFIIMFTSAFSVPHNPLQAESPLKRINVLEITPNGLTTLSSLTTESSFQFNGYDIQIATMAMKRFVALREELDGKYDMIIIGEGFYNPAGVNGRNHNTSSVMNDLTNLKADELIESFVNKGQPLFIHKDSVNNGAILQKRLGSLPQSSVIYYAKADWANLGRDFEQLMSSTYQQKPSFTLTSKPKSIQYNSHEAYKRGETVQFTMKIDAPSSAASRSMKLRLYIDRDFNDQFQSSEIVKEVNVSSQTPSLSYELPLGYSGVRTWKLELIEVKNNTVLKDYEVGQFLFEDEPIKINVLQVFKGSNSSLKNANNMKQSYLTQDKQYSISIDTTDFSVFNSGVGSSQNSRLYSHELINGKYDMVIFGFADTYNSSNLSQGAVNSLKKFIDSKQSILFTHDTIFNRNNVWVNNFKGTTGQMDPETNLGLNAPNQSKTTQKVNEGLVTTFPFDLPENVGIQTTHNQYYTLDLEDPNVIPWYNITGSGRDTNDSWNHYYTYSKGNITYSGTGHTSSNFPDSEQRLFVNTMYRAFSGSNHAPVITVLSPETNETIPSNQKIPLSFKVEDFDLTSTTNNVKVYVNNKLQYEEKASLNGKTFNLQLDHYLKDGGAAEIKITAEDQEGAESVHYLTLEILKNENLLEVARTFEPEKSLYEAVKDSIAVKYSIAPKEINRSSSAGEGDQILSDLSFREKFPPGIDVLEMPQGFRKSGTKESGITVEGNLRNIQYETKDKKTYTGKPVHFTLTIRAEQSSTYLLQQAVLTYKDFFLEEKEAEFNRLSLSAAHALKEVKLTPSIVLDKGLERNLRASGDFTISPSNAAIREVKWSSSDESIVSISQNGVIKAAGKGAAQVTVTVTDVFGNQMTKTSSVSVRVPIESISLDSMVLFAGETIDLPLTVNPADASGSVEITFENDRIASVNTATKKITGIKPGSTRVIARGVNENGTIIEAEALVTVKSREIEQLTVNPNEITINKYETFSDFELTVLPEYGDASTVTWTSADPSVAQVVSPGEIRGIKAGVTTILLQAPSGVTEEIKVTVHSPLTDAGFDQDFIVISKGDTYPLSGNLMLTPADASTVESIIYKDTISANPFITVKPDGSVFGKRIGEGSMVEVTVRDKAGNEYKDTILVHVREKESDPEENSETGDDRY
ncbi:DUF5057 domain-containing protein [Jeotgalibacillus campisalis]|uniref:BIG2 domain-containing protein n=1 Tax=Jeotgalibacillus campisalis TaxID=220754 RepID=A0A0C2VP47_9BACL|nr:DUF5057 domain-containing protein [Jeotgalibacillus campisalis]KIL46221.1 hypothetical protein KR50_28960 [Jeotgalibacillus campisalis]